MALFLGFYELYLICTNKVKSKGKIVKHGTLCGECSI